VDVAKAHRRRFQWVVKAQIHAGGRGKAGGVKWCKTLETQVRDAAAKGMLGTKMVTYQSGGRALPVNLVLVTEATDIARSCTCRCWSTAPPRVRSPSSPRPMGGVEIETGRPRASPDEDPHPRT
jgi:succinyl-CoA synthetase beta subunit